MNNVPARADERAMQAYTPPKELIPGYGNITHEDLVVPRIKLLQGMSPECSREGGGWPQGEYFHTSEGRSIGTEIRVVPLGIKKTVEGWPPRGSKEEGQGILFRSSDGIHWDPGDENKEFVFEFLDGGRETWFTGRDVKSSGLCEFKNGPPPVGYTWRQALYLPEFPLYPATLYIASRTAGQSIIDLNGKVLNRHNGGTPHYAQVYKMGARVRKGAGKISWYVPTFEPEGNLTDKALIADLKERSLAIHRANVKTYDEDERLGGKEEKGRRDTYEGRPRQRESRY